MQGSVLPPDGETVFVGGCMRSGTSLLHRILCQSEDSNPYIQASFYLTRQLELYVRTVQQGSMFTDDLFGDAQGLREFTRETICRLLDRVRRRWQDPRVLVLKQTELTMYMPLLAQFLPAARFVVSVRDPRDTVSSMIEVGQRHSQKQQDSPYSRAGRDPVKLSQLYNRVYAPLLKACDADDAQLRGRTSFVRYEDVIGDTRSTVTSLADFTGLPLYEFAQGRAWRPDGVAGQASEHPYWSAYRTALSGQPISDASVGKHAYALSEEERSIVESRCAALMKRFDYA